MRMEEGRRGVNFIKEWLTFDDRYKLIHFFSVSIETTFFHVMGVKNYTFALWDDWLDEIVMMFSKWIVEWF